MRFADVKLQPRARWCPQMGDSDTTISPRNTFGVHMFL